MKVEYDITIPHPKMTKHADIIEKLNEFIMSEHFNMCFTLDDIAQAKAKSAALTREADKINKNKEIETELIVYRRKNKVYVSKIEN